MTIRHMKILHETIRAEGEDTKKREFWKWVRFLRMDFRPLCRNYSCSPLTAREMYRFGKARASLNSLGKKQVTSRAQEGCRWLAMGGWWKGVQINNQHSGSQAPKPTKGEDRIACNLSQLIFQEWKRWHQCKIYICVWTQIKIKIEHT